MKTLETITAPLAIAMWDSTWLRRRYRGGGFEDWDKALAALTSRGYNAVRIDAFPHLVARSPDGTLVETFKDIPDHHPNFYGFGMWGSQWTNYISPRQSLIEFVRKCGEHGVRVALSTWLKPTADRRNEQIEGADGIVRIWDETLRFLEENGCLGSVVSVDPLNELPVGFCMPWYHSMLSMLSRPAADGGGPYNGRQRDFVRGFVDGVFIGLKEKWPTISIGGSISHGEPRNGAMDFSVMDFIDGHIWINFCPAFIAGTQYWETIGRHGHPDYLFKREPVGGGYEGQRYRMVPQDCDYDVINAVLGERWHSRRAEWAAWLEGAAAATARLGKAHGIPVGNTEGWGMVLWAEHPLLDWTIQREAAEIGAKAGAAHGYLFNCSANFCHPHHIGFWEDVAWHRSITASIKSGRPVAIPCPGT